MKDCKDQKTQNLLQKPKTRLIIHADCTVQAEDLKPKIHTMQSYNPDGDRLGYQGSFVEQCENISSVKEPRSTRLLLKGED